MDRHNIVYGRPIHRLTAASLLAALIFCATYFIRIPVLSGYIHAGDGFVYLAAASLGTPYAIAAAVIGAGLSDLIGGYPLWIPVTVAVRILSVLCFSHRGGFVSRRNILALVISALITAVGYWGYEAAVVYHSAVAALAGVPFNLLQSLLGAIVFLAVGRAADRFFSTGTKQGGK